PEDDPAAREVLTELGVGHEDVVEAIEGDRRVADLGEWEGGRRRTLRVDRGGQHVGAAPRSPPGGREPDRHPRVGRGPIGRRLDVRQDLVVGVQRVAGRDRAEPAVVDGAETRLIDDRRREDGRDCPVLEGLNFEPGRTLGRPAGRRGQVLAPKVANASLEVHGELTRVRGPAGGTRTGPRGRTRGRNTPEKNISPPAARGTSACTATATGPPRRDGRRNGRRRGAVPGGSLRRRVGCVISRGPGPRGPEGGVNWPYSTSRGQALATAPGL